MSDNGKLFLWLCGVIILIILVQIPAHHSEQTWTTFPLPLSGQTIVIDPGHGGPDGGAVGKDGTMEKDIALTVSHALRDYLQEAGALVYLTREDDSDLAGQDVHGLSRRKSADIRNRLAFIQERHADLFISIHLNALPSSRWRGAQTFYYPRFPENEFLATMIQEEIIRNLENTDRVPLQMDHVYLLKFAEVPGALVEIGFLSHNDERELLKDKTYQQQMAASIYQGIVRYVTEVHMLELNDDLSS